MMEMKSTLCCAFGCDKRKKKEGRPRSDSEGSEDEESERKRKLPRTFHNYARQQMPRQLLRLLQSMAGEYTLNAFEQRALLAKEKLNSLHQYLGKLQQTIFDKEETRLKTENKQLLAKVSSLKNQLKKAELENGANQVAISSMKNEGVLKAKQQLVSTPVAKVTPADDDAASKTKEAKPKEAKKNVTKQVKKSPDEKPVDFSRLDFRVAQIAEVKRHPDADTLYVEQIQTGEESLRTVVTGLVKHVPIEQMQDRMVVLMCNLKPAKMRGIVSQGMVMCADNGEAAEIIEPPVGSVPGDRIVVEGYAGTPDAMLNPKKKVFEKVQPDLRTNDQCVACYKDIPFTVQGKGICKVKSLRNCRIK